ncbi:uncharacterized protein EI97DRAFT_417431 [Westerdykella ornata]|uniref:Uncharacterized protein n=1 Tax=Westerdykella ornata TaxID=318751 RepID=A0A6A6JQM1_WESOR|nr:uncharacterized protein EI97DRAFT_417431 [Westerdykella ornata]KAF2277259.1 hypothetical protein EI97DRAFT_417431 [Westerdykella ornata]
MKAIFWLSVLSQFLESSAQAQKVIACPELIGGAPQPCVNQECGNEDPENKGHCANKASDESHCACDPAATAAQPLVTSVVTAPPISGETSAPSGAPSATFALATLTQYKDLRESITATLTVSPTQSGEPAATVAAVVFAGGVAWYLAGYVGAEAAALTAPKEAPPGHENDEKCKDVTPKCKDCGATLGFCVEPNPGCACDDKEEEKKCPEKKPSCEATECKGDNGKCTLDGLKDCECEESIKCPDDIDAPFCSACGGEEADTAQCAGGAPCCKGDETGKYKGCRCYKEDGVGVDGLERPDDRAVLAALWKNVEEQEQPVCQKQNPDLSEVTAPQHIKDGDPSVEKAAKEWCASMDGKTVGVKDGEVPHQFVRSGDTSFWLSASFRNTGDCGNEAKIVGDECAESMMRAVEGCEPNQKTTHGAALGKGCFFYNVTVSGSLDADHPPWEGNKGQPQCDRKVSSIEGTFFRGLYPQFCSQVKDGKAIKTTLTNKDFKPPSKSKRSPPPSSNQYEDYKFNFEFSGGENCKISCEDAFSKLRDGCSGTTTLMYKGSIDAGCGTYSYSIEDPPPPTVCKPKEQPEALGPVKTCNEGNLRALQFSGCGTPKPFIPKEVFQAGAHQFCYGGFDFTAKPDDKWSAANRFWMDKNVIDPSTNLPKVCTGNQRFACESKIEIMVVPAKDQTGCKPLKEHKLAKDGDCTKMLDEVSEACITPVTDGYSNKTGGFFLEKSEDGCWEWWIWAAQYGETDQRDDSYGRN